MRRSTSIAGALAVTVALGCLAGTPTAGAIPGRARAERPGDTVWLCRPGLADNPCTADRTATRVAATGKERTERPTPPKKRPIDCFYVYPTVSLQPTINANFDIEPNETNVAIAQVSRFSSVCRVYAPIYRQLTLRAIGGGITAEAAALAYGDVRNAWRDYLAKYNHGRGVVLIGHSQGAGMLTQLARKEIDPKRRARKRLVSALLLGGNVVVPKGKDVGGDFRHLPACRTPRQTGCVVAYSTFNQTPPADATFSRVDAGFNRVRGGGITPADAEILCVNPAHLGGSGEAHGYYPTHLELGVLGGALPEAAVRPIPKPWVRYPGLLTASCHREGGASWLQVDDQRAPGGTDPRPALINSLGPGWGLHLVDVNVVLGDLVGLVRTQGAAWSAQH